MRCRAAEAGKKLKDHEKRRLCSSQMNLVSMLWNGALDRLRCMLWGGWRFQRYSKRSIDVRTWGSSQFECLKFRTPVSERQWQFVRMLHHVGNTFWRRRHQEKVWTFRDERHQLGRGPAAAIGDADEYALGLGADEFEDATPRRRCILDSLSLQVPCSFSSLFCLDMSDVYIYITDVKYAWCMYAWMTHNDTTSEWCKSAKWFAFAGTWSRQSQS